MSMADSLVTKIGSPSQVRDWIRGQLPVQVNADLPNLLVQPCDERGRQSPAWSAHHYRIHAYYVSSGKPLDYLEQLLAGIPGVYETHQVRDGNFGHLRDLRVQVIALIKMPEEKPGEPRAFEVERKLPIVLLGDGFFTIRQREALPGPQPVLKADVLLSGKNGITREENIDGAWKLACQVAGQLGSWQDVLWVSRNGVAYYICTMGGKDCAYWWPHNKDENIHQIGSGGFCWDCHKGDPDVDRERCGLIRHPVTPWEIGQKPYKKLNGPLRFGGESGEPCKRCGGGYTYATDDDLLYAEHSKTCPVLYPCPVCQSLGVETEHELYDHPQLGDKFHGQYDPGHPELISYRPPLPDGAHPFPEDAKETRNEP